MLPFKDDPNRLPDLGKAEPSSYLRMAAVWCALPQSGWPRLRQPCSCLRLCSRSQSPKEVPPLLQEGGGDCSIPDRAVVRDPWPPLVTLLWRIWGVTPWYHAELADNWRFPKLLNILSYKTHYGTFQAFRKIEGNSIRDPYVPITPFISSQYFANYFTHFCSSLHLLFYFWLKYFKINPRYHIIPPNAKDSDLIPGSGRCPGEADGNPLQYSCLENPMVRGAWWATAHGVAKTQTQLSN